MSAAQEVEAVFSLYEREGHREYFGEEVTQLEHAVQCGMLAEKDGYAPQVFSQASLTIQINHVFLRSYWAHFCMTLDI
jgi:predicted HD phosphohydrolase